MYKRLICSAAVAAVCGGAWATTTMTWYGYGNGYNWLPFTISNTVSGTTTTENNVYAGSLLLTATTDGSTSNLEAYCTSPFTWLASSKTWQADLTKNKGVVDEIAKIAGVSVTNQDLGAAVQLAIWDKVAGPYFSWSTSTGYASTIRGLYNELVGGTYAGLPTDIPNYSFWKANPTGTSQDMITLDGGTHLPNQTTPEPFTMTLCAGGLGLAVIRRRRAAK